MFPELQLQINNSEWEITVQKKEGFWEVVDGIDLTSEENGIYRQLDNGEIQDANEMIESFESRLDARWELKLLASNKGKIK